LVKKILHITNIILFIDGQNYILRSRVNLLEKIDWILNPNNLVQVNKIRFEEYELVKNFHTSTNRYNKVLEILNNSDKII
jgi:hypothetical protein